jgi:hypothetical protein
MISSLLPGLLVGLVVDCCLRPRRFFAHDYLYVTLRTNELFGQIALLVRGGTLFRLFQPPCFSPKKDRGDKMCSWALRHRAVVGPVRHGQIRAENSSWMDVLTFNPHGTYAFTNDLLSIDTLSSTDLKLAFHADPDK